MRVNQTKSADLYLDGDNNKSVNARKNLKTFNNAFLVGLIAIVLFFVSFVFTQQKQSDINYKLVIFQLVLLFIAFVSSAVSMSYSLLQKKLKTASKNTTEDEPLGYSQNIFTQTWQNLVLFFTNPVV
jgi:cell division protein FtsL